jgi:hypothetical protein
VFALPSDVATAIMRLLQCGHRVASMITPPISSEWANGAQVTVAGFCLDFRESSMQAAIDRVMHTYGLLVNLTAEQEQVAREKVSHFLASAHTDDENKLAVEGLRYLRASPPERGR